MESWIHIPENSDFPPENIPFGVFSTPNNPTHRIGTAIGDQILDIKFLAEHGYFGNDVDYLLQPIMNDFMSLGKSARVFVRTTLQDLITGQNPSLKNNPEHVKQALVSQKDAQMHLPARIGDYTDFYSSIHHATNVGIIFRGKDNALQPNWLHLPVGYHGRASSVLISGSDIVRPKGQLCNDHNKAPPVFDSSKLFDFELETAFFVGKGNNLGEPVDINNCDDNIFGMVVMNDWSARDIQKWEYVPLGPFLGKNMGTVISPWIVTPEALKPFTVPNMQMQKEILPYLKHEDDFNFDIKLTVDILPEDFEQEVRICNSNFKYLYWTMKQQLAHHTVNGCNSQPGDLYGSGTISGPTDQEYGSMLELSWRGTREIDLGNGHTRKFLKDNDTIIMRARCEKEGQVSIGFGEARSKLLPARK